MTSTEEIEKRLEAAEATLQPMLCTVTADLIMFQAAVKALREDCVLTMKMIDRMAINAQLRLQQYDSPALSPPMSSKIALHQDALEGNPDEALDIRLGFASAGIRTAFDRIGARRPRRYRRLPQFSM